MRHACAALPSARGRNKHGMVAANERRKRLHGVNYVTPSTRSVFFDLFDSEEAAELEMRSVLLVGLQRWLSDSRLTQSTAAKTLRLTRREVSEIRRGAIGRLPLGLLVRLVTRAGLRFKITIAA